MYKVTGSDPNSSNSKTKRENRERKQEPQLTRYVNEISSVCHPTMPKK